MKGKTRSHSAASNAEAQTECLQRQPGPSSVGGGATRAVPCEQLAAQRGRAQGGAGARSNARTLRPRAPLAP